ncbi:hypothetical protein PM10SUCC1_18130 [Propionigenium maris DSM 9537]|uniref:Homoserine dehydrogenase n=1 Tax=Propionigenium maris DSM 9537 TaxID=1123000 RepID=A0A9W6LMX9_9FUSO|nr:homoserine dehydrogenase [Propionigenium maris]GLI56299.1 hypothetical protein PM10SUCC1_18130 [Propionigenium maris DSM 9537]
MKLGVIGLGTVGEGVLKILAAEGSRLEAMFGEKIEVVRVCDIEEKSFSFGEYNFTDNYRKILEDGEIDTVVELIGGVGVALEVAREVLGSGRNLVSANKHLLALHGKELFELAEKNRVKFYFEAAVGGGIPVLTPLAEGLFPNRFERIRGVLNGTCNYMLSKMEEGMTYGEALRDAQERGYAEADPTFDVAGIDTGHKISVLSYLAWGELVDFSSISITGIDKLTVEDVARARSEGKRYKLLGEAFKEGEDLVVRVAPQLVDTDELLYSVGGVYNAVEVEGSYTGKTIFYGEGAGMDATASAVVSDIYKVIAG